MIIIYNILLFFYFTIAIPFYLVKFFTSERYRIGLMERLGFVQRMPPGRRILVHTVSVGEFLASVPLLNALRNRYQQYEIIVSTTTVTGNRVAKKKVGDSYKVIYFPLDFPFSVKRFFERVSPNLVILVETELWPNFLDVSRKRNIPILIVNGRISENSYRNYSILKGFFRNMCSGIKIWGVQFERDKRRLVNLGIASERVSVTGSLKFDSAVQQIPDVDRIKREWGLKEGTLLLVGGSTHRGEEKILLDIYREIKDNFGNLVLILAPRHPERAGEIKTLIDGYGLRNVKRSEWRGTHARGTPTRASHGYPGGSWVGTRISNYEVVLVDTLGELISIYNLANIVFIGKSLVKGGGQNLLEPAGLGKPVICGPLMGNFLDITQWLVENGGVIQVRDTLELKQAIVHLLNNPQECIKLGNRARGLVLSATGAVERNMVLVDSAL